MMTQTTVDRETLKQTLKEALTETLHEERELLHEVFAEVLQDLALGEAIRKGLETQPATREEVFDVIEGRAWRPPCAKVSRVISKSLRTE